VKPAPFAYHRPASVDEAVDMLADGQAKVLAGGQSLIPLMSMRLAAPASLVDINHIDGLADVVVTETSVRIGALTRHRALELDDGAFAANPLLRRAVSHVAHATIRNRGTTVGSLVHADPAAEMPAVLALLDGTVRAVNKSGERSIIAADFFAGPMESALAPDELAVSATFANPPTGGGSSWVELSRRQGDYAMVGVGAVVVLDPSGHVSSARVALISVGPTPEVVDVSAACAGASYDRVDWTDAGDLVESRIDPEGDIHATAEYRRHLAITLSRRALAAALADSAARVAA